MRTAYATLTRTAHATPKRPPTYFKKEHNKNNNADTVMCSRKKAVLLYTECQSSFFPVSYWLRTYHVIVEKFYCLPGNVAKRWSLLLFTGK